MNAMFLVLLLATAVPVALATSRDSQVSCIALGVVTSEASCERLGCHFSEDGACWLAGGETRVLPLSAPHSRAPALRLVAALDTSGRAATIHQGAAFNVTLTEDHLSLHVSPGLELSLEHVHVFGLPAHVARPRVLRLNGQLLRRADLHFHAKSQSLEVFDLSAPLAAGLELQLLNEDAEADQIECPVSYSVRNPDYSIPESACMSPCVWNAGCWMPSTLQYGYFVSGPSESTQFGVRVPLRKFGPSLYGQDVQNIVFELFVYSETLIRAKFYDPAEARYEVPIPLAVPTAPFTGTSQLQVVYPEVEGAPFSLQVVRVDTGTVLFDTSLSGLTFEDQLLSISLRLPSRNLYGLGESYHSTFRRQLDDSTWPLWSRDELPNPAYQHNVYGVHPFYEVVENDGNAHGVLLYNSNAMDYQLQSGAPAVVFRTIGGILDLYVVSGPHPEDVVKQYTGLVGRSFLPPYWSFGFQVSRWGFENTNHIRTVVERTRSCGIPLDVFYGDVDVMDNQGDFTVDPINFPDLPTFVDEQRALGMRYVPILDPAIPNRTINYPTFDRGLQADVFIRWGAEEGGEVLMGNVWPPEPVAFPDFFKNSTYNWWTDEIRRFYDVIKFDGLWIDMNEPANFDTNIPDPEGGYRLLCPVSSWDDPPYLPKAGVVGSTPRISDKTICLSTTQGEGGKYRHYDVHSLYGYSQTIPTSASLQQVTGKRGLVFTRSSFVGSGILGGHWTGDNAAGWDHMQYSVIGLLDLNLFGIPYVGADICGFFGHTEERLCERWQELGAFYPFSRNHNSIGAIEQDPCVWPNTVGESTRKAMEVRYRLLPFFYTTFYRANQGLEGTVIRALLHQFPEDRETLGIDRQFLWSDTLLISPALDEGSLDTFAYFPAGVWYDYYTGKPTNSVGQYLILEVPYDHIPVHVRGGRIIPVQLPGSTTTASRENAFGLVVAPNDAGVAQGDLFWDDGESIDTVQSGNYHYSTFAFNVDTLTQTVSRASPALLQGRFVEDLELLGVSALPSAIQGDVGPDVTITFDPANQKVTLGSAHIPIHANFTVRFIFN